MKHPVIKIDLRERRSGLPGLLEKNGFFPEYRELEAGDYCIGERFIIERKTGSDFLISLNDGRLFEQCRKIQQSHLFPLLLLEGNPFSISGQTNPLAIKAAFIAVSAGWQIPILYSKDIHDSCRTINQLINQQINRRRFVMAHARKGHPSADAATRFIQGIPGLGANKSENLLQDAGTIRKLINMDEQKLARIKGIGPATARKITSFLDQPFIADPASGHI